MIANAGIAHRTIRSNVESPFHPMVLSGIKWLPTAIAILLAGACMGGPAQAQQPQQAGAAQQAAAGAPSKTAPRGVNQGIQVSGYWKIDIRNPDGTLVKHVEFENSVTSDAIKFALPSALFGQQAGLGAGSKLNGAHPNGVPITGVDAPFIGVNSGPAINSEESPDIPVFPWYGGEMVQNGTGYTGSPCGPISGCLIAKSNSAAYYSCTYYDVTANPAETAPGCFNGLSVQYGQGTADATVLSGSFVATATNPIYDVWSYITLCLPSFGQIGSATCPLSTVTTVSTSSPQPVPAMAIDLTSYTLPTPLSVSAGQSVNVSVSLTFSSVASTSPSGNTVPGSSTDRQAARPLASSRKP